jgi:tetratricopeptide (TPR) repeat protein
MQTLATYRKRIVAAFCGLLMAVGGALAQDADLQRRMDGWFQELADPDNPNWGRALTDIQREWSKSGSPAMDLLLKRGQDAMEAGDIPAAIEHLTALTDQAPDFAEGWNARATAYYLAGMYGPSIADVERVLVLNPRHFGAIAGLGLILRDTGHKEAAVRAFRESLTIHPHQDGIRQALEQLERDASGTDI